jgi:NAD(P)-dependent dehydrogenase (short-subunit alcohol dehydrogenase family)
MEAKLRGKVSLITGGNSGIGRVTALLFSAHGARVAIAARDRVRGQGTVEEIAHSGGQGIFISCDVRLAADCHRAVERSVEVFGSLDILVNSAGVIYPHRSVLDTSEEEWDRTMAVNVKGVYLMSRVAIPRMIEGGGGCIINVASVWGLAGGTGAAAYCASKGAVVLLTKAMALDHAGQNIRVNCICPGSVDTPMLRDEMAALGGVEQARPAFAARHPLNRICTPDEVAQAALYLASDAASFVTGSSLVIDGGRTAGGRP